MAGKSIPDDSGKFRIWEGVDAYAYFFVTDPGFINIVVDDNALAYAAMAIFSPRNG